MRRGHTRPTTERRGCEHRDRVPRAGNTAAGNGDALARPPGLARDRRCRGRVRRAARPPRARRRTRRASPAPATPSSRCSSPRSSRGKRCASRSRRRSSFAGHSLGQVTALIAAGVLPLDAGVRFAARRAELTQAAADAHPGRMAALLGATVEQAEDACTAAPDGCWVANDNAPGQVVIAGHPRRRRRRLGPGQGARREARHPAQRRRRVPHPADGRRPPTASSASSPASRSARPTAPVVSNHDAPPVRRRRRLARPAPRARARAGPLAHLDGDDGRARRHLVPRGRARLDDRRPRQAHRPRRPRPQHRHPRRPRLTRGGHAEWKPCSTTAKACSSPSA